MQSRVRSKASLDKNNSDRIGNNDIYTHIPIHNEQTINPHAPVQFPSSFYVHIFITQNTRILFHKAHLYKSIRFIFTCEKSLYSQSELRTAISHVEV